MEFEIKNVKKVSDDEYMCEINHIKYGWIPYTALRSHSSDDIMMKTILEKCDSIKDVDIALNVITDNARIEYIVLCEQKIDELEKDYTSREMSLWDTKVREAEKVISGENSSIIEVESNLKNISQIELSKKIKLKNEKYINTVVEMETIKSNIVKDFSNISDIKQLDALKIKYDSILRTR